MSSSSPDHRSPLPSATTPPGPAAPSPEAPVPEEGLAPSESTSRPEAPVQPGSHEPSGDAELVGAPELTGAPEVSDEAGSRLAAEGLRPVSPKLIPARYLAGIPGYVIGVLLTIGAVVATVLTEWWWPAAVGVVPLVLVAQGLLLTPRRARAIGYRDAEEDLTIASGIMFRTVHTIPYGRVQSVKIDEGPVDRRYGLAKLSISTAHGGEGITLPGLPKEEAERLRALLTARGVELMAAL